MKKLLLILLMMPIVILAQEPLYDRYLTDFYESGENTYTMYKVDKRGIFGNPATMRNKVIKKAHNFAKERGKKIEFVSQEKTLMSPGVFATFTYIFRLVPKDK